MKTPCPDPDDVELLVAGKLSKEVSQELESHLLTCEHCLQLAESSIAADEINTLFAVGETSQIIPNDAPLLSSLIERGAKLLSDKQPDSDEQTWLGQEVEDTTLSRQEKKQLQLHEEATSFLLPPEEEDELGRLGGYRILEILGSGGMGVVFRAEDPRLKRQVALKAMKPAIATDQEAKLRFLREAEATAAIEHDNIVTIYQVGEENGVPFIAMQLLKGESLKSRMSRRDRLSQEETIRIGSQIAAGLQAAHERGLIHRDIKPDNIWLQEGTDRVRIVDFGLVRNNADDVELTTSGVVLGTPRYMSPEQAQGQAVDHRCDLFSLGSVLYRLVSGQDAFSGNVVTAVLVAVASGAPAPLRELVPEIDPDLDLIIQTLLKKNPAERYATAADVEVRLNQIQPGSTSTTGSMPETLLADKRTPPRSRILLTGAAFFGVMLLAGIIITLINKDGSRTTIRTGDDTRIEISSDDGGVDDVRQLSKNSSSQQSQDMTTAKIDFAAERKAAEWVLSIGGSVGLVEGASLTWMDSKQALPDTPFVLDSVNLQDTAPISNGALKQLAQAKHITGLNLHYHQVGMEGLRSLTDLPLTVLILAGTRIDYGDLPEIVEEFPSLRTIDLRGIRGDSGENLSPLVSLSSLEVIALDTDQILPEAVHLGKIKTLRHLDIAYQPTPISVEMIRAVSRIRQLTELNLVGSQLAPGVIGEIVLNGSLRTLELRGCQVTDEDLPTLSVMSGLEALYLQSTQVTETGVQKLATAIPQCRIQWDQGIIEPSSTWHGWPADAPKPAIAPFDAVQAKKHQEEWAAYLGVPVEYENSIGMKFRLIPPGEFTMGSTPEEIEEALKIVNPNDPYGTQWQNCIRSETPQHKVIITQPVYLGVTEVTQAEYMKVSGKNPSYFTKAGPDKKKAEIVSGLDTSSYPVENLSWGDATKFCSQLSHMEDLKPFYSTAGEIITPRIRTGYLLPTEAEWEFACRGGTTTKFWIGDTEWDLGKAGWFSGNNIARTHSAGELQKNPFGLFDTHGNVSEWVEDCWEPDYYVQFQDQPAIDPYGPRTGLSERVIRGGRIDWKAPLCRSSFRITAISQSRPLHNGFRVALTVDAVRQLTKSSIARTEPQRTKAGPEDPQRRVAEMVIERGGWVGIQTLSSFSSTSKLEELPQERFAIGEVGLHGNTQLTDADIQILGNIYSGRMITHSNQNLSDEAIRSIASTGLVDYTRSSFTMTDQALALFAEKIQPYSLNIPSMSASPQLEQSLARMTSLRSLEWALSGAESGVTADGLKGLAKLPGLYHLYLHGHGLTGERVALLAASENLQLLNIPANPLTDEDIPHLSALKNLRLLDLTATRLSKDGLLRLRELLPNTDIIHPELPADDDQKRIVQWVLSEGGVVDVRGVGPVEAPPVQSFAAAYIAFIDPATSPDGSEANQLAGLKALQTLRLDFLKNSDIALETISTLDSLVQLELNVSDISTAGMKQVGKLKQLELLALNGCTKLNDEGVSYLTDLKHIYHLQLGATPISGSGLLHLGQIPSLQRLHLNECQRISDEGIQHLVSLPRLKYLDLSGTTLTDACIPHLSQMQSLRILSLDRTKITAEGAAKLQAALPKCVVFHESLKDTPWRLPESEVPAVATAPFNAEQAKAHQEAWARYLGKPIEFDNSLELEFSLIPPGEFVMGSPENEEGRFTDENQVPVTITAPFWMSKTEVTQQIWQKVMKTTPWTGDEHVISESHNPVTNVSWNDAVEFCQKFTQLERESGKLADGLVYRLPTEAEWEYACRSGSQTAFTYGNDISQLGDYAWWGGVSGGSASNQRYAHAVALKKPNAWGLYDMHGNVFEWCEDHYALQITGGADPIVRLEEGNRVARSGGYDDPPTYCRSADRFEFTPGDKRSYLGFRIVLSQIPTTPVTDKPHEGTP